MPVVGCTAEDLEPRSKGRSATDDCKPYGARGHEIGRAKKSQSPEDLGESWLARRVEKRPYQVAPRPVRLLRRLSREEDARREAEVRQLVEQPNWRELEPAEADDDEDWQATDIEDFRLFDLMEEDPTEQSAS